MTRDQAACATALAVALVSLYSHGSHIASVRHCVSYIVFSKLLMQPYQLSHSLPLPPTTHLCHIVTSQGICPGASWRPSDPLSQNCQLPRQIRTRQTSTLSREQAVSPLVHQPFGSACRQQYLLPCNRRRFDLQPRSPAAVQGERCPVSDGPKSILSS